MGSEGNSAVQGGDSMSLTAGCCSVEVPISAPTASHAEALTTEFKALADTARLRLFLQIAQADGEVCVCHLDDVGLSQPTVSHHLGKLRNAGLVSSERRGTWVHYSVTARGERIRDLVLALS